MPHFTITTAYNCNPPGELETAAADWRTHYDGPITTEARAFAAARVIGKYFKAVNVFRGKNIGRLCGGVYQGRAWKSTGPLRTDVTFLD